EKQKPTLVLLDSHAIIHRAYHALPELTDKDGRPAGALYGLAAMLVKLIKELKPDYMAAAYDLAGPTHRHEVYEAYKGTRAKIEDSLVEQLDRSRDIFAAFHIPMYEAPGFEADDVIGTLAVLLKSDFNIVIASGDMDTMQLVDGKKVRVFTLKKGINDTVLYDEEAVKERFGFAPEHIPDYKGFAGDPSDNIIGISGIGAKTATKLIQAYGSVEDIYKKIHDSRMTIHDWKKIGVSERVYALLKEGQEEAEFSKVLATIRTDAPVIFDTAAANWRDVFSAEHAVKLFTALGFRSLVPRIESLAGKTQNTNHGADNAEDKPVGTEIIPSQQTAVLAAPEAESMHAKEAKVAWWLLNPDATNPSVDDVLHGTGVQTIEDAHAKLMRSLKEEKLDGVYENIEKPLIPVIDTLNATGILIDAPYLQSLSKEYHAELDALAVKIFKQAGGEFNLNSPKQLSEVLFVKMSIKAPGVRQKKTATGQISTKESELVKLQNEHPIIKDILAHRELQKLLSTYIDAIPPLLGADGRLRTTFIQTGAATGRFASREPNLQNIPVKSELGRRIRHAFVAGEGKLLVAFDYSQIELRLAALLSGDKKLKDIFIRGEDVHNAVAAEVFGVPPEEVAYEMRRRAKVVNFGILYGMGVNALKEQLGTERPEAQEYLNRYFATFSGLASYLARTKVSAARLGYTKTLFGRKRFFPGIASRLPFVRAQAERMAINAPIQGTQADIIKRAMVQIQERIDNEFRERVSMVLQIHDELIFEVEEESVGTFSKAAKQIMESVLTREEMGGVPILVSSEAGHSWSDMEPIKY
ncbi:hypothetical protein COU18_01960, partial [Candidatus Kaiserbacteria bacterium CG10_big_fil_rev_8_21_14_0_10_51_14]